MKTIITILVAVIIGFYLSGCNEDGSVFNLPESNQTDKMTFTITGSADGSILAPMGIDKPMRRFEGTGQSIPGGEISGSLNYLITSGNAFGGTIGFGTGELITENGDKIYAMSITGTYTSPDGINLTFNATGVLAGGTGDYDNIMGTINYTGTANQITRQGHAEWTGTFTREEPFGGNITAQNVTVSGSCAPGYLRRHVEGNAVVLHLGQVYGSVEHCVNFTNGIITAGSGSLNGANSDKVDITYNGYALPLNSGTAAVTLFCTIAGGTGRFDGATGYFTLNGTQILPEGEVTGNLEGVINY